MSDLATLTIDVNGFATRVWRQGSGPRLGFLAGFGGLPRSVPFIDELAKSRTVIVPSLPGFPGGDRGHTVLDTHLDWVLTVHEILVRSELIGADLAGSSVGGSLAAEIAAIWADAVPGLMCADPAIWTALKTAPEGANSIEWPIEQTRASEAAARIFWPLGNTKLEKRLGLITAPTLLLWGEQDRVMPRSYADRFGGRIKGRSEVKVIAGAGHLAELDQPKAVAEAILGWTA